MIALTVGRPVILGVGLAVAGALAATGLGRELGPERMTFLFAAAATAVLSGIAAFGWGKVVMFEGRRREQDLSRTVHALRERDSEASRHAASLALLNQELAHRYKNFLAVVQMIAERTLAQASDLDTARLALSDRIAALGATATILAAPDCEAALLETVARTMISPHDPDGTRIVCSGPPIMLPSSMVLGMALALHELATNAVKYGALSSPTGRIDVRWSVQRNVYENDDARWEDVLCFSWREAGGPVVTPPTRQGFGSLLIKRAVNSYFSGSGNLDFAPEGLVFSMEAPLPAAFETSMLSE
ncbi:HWE histidine kinase domain-containing protein [Sphingomonas nostoxanthinifaciens]|uniref:HWE histidine kinase domain-containing protein n=1 Tax=Sphingomonas nostoxanthinifaciens TaxID=2872652 RepID=UPI001CC1D92A|nr:HWE histidine kinase domain-containing protein [Sphingomonas nostoxanthinifaciens]UAK26275.1 hypothetical protein K8P63_09395 [Sphingomonas nostoxanthinifaciens]